MAPAHSGITSSAPVCRLLGFWHLEIRAGHQDRCHSGDHHLLHLVLNGGYTLRLAGCEYPISAGSCIWYHDHEAVQWLGDERDVAVLSCRFAAAPLAAPPAQRRVWSGSARLRQHFTDLRQAIGHCNDRADSIEAEGHLHLLIAAALKATSDQGSDPWQQVESWVTQHDAHHLTLSDIATALGRSEASLDRACRAAHACGPATRIRHLRLERAAAMLTQTPLPIDTIARLLHFRDGSALARACQQHFGLSPSRMRRG